MATPLRVAFDMTFPNRNPAGSGVYATELLGELSGRDDVAIVTVAADRGGGFPRTMRWLTGQARRAVAGTNVVHCPAFVAPWRLGVPFVLTVHDTSTQKFPEDHPFEWRAYTRLLLPERARSAARVITGTEYSRRDIIRELGVPAGRVAVTPYGVAAIFSRRSLVKKGVAEPPILLFPGAPTRRKNLELVLQAMAAAPETSMLRRARLVITGADSERFPNQRERIKTLALEGRVSWLGKVAAETMPDVVSGADIVVYPSLHEGFGFPALEAMAVGTPVVASNATCLPEVLGDGALLVDPHDVRAFMEAVDALLSSTDLRCDLIEKGKQRAATYTWQRCADLTMDVYRQAATVRGRTALVGP